MADLTDAAIQAAIAYWLKQQGDKPPKTYPVPLTPEDQWKFGQQKDLYGSLNNFVGQYLGGMNQTPDFKFHSPIFANDKFAGGMHLPNIDFSKIGGSLGSAGGGGANAPGVTGPGASSPSGGLRNLNNKDFVSDSLGGPGPATMPEYDPNKNVGVPGRITSQNPTGDTPSMFSGGTPPAGMSYGQLSAPDMATIKQFASQYGKAGVEIFIAVLTANPVLGVKGAYDAIKAWMNGGPKPAGVPEGTLPPGVGPNPGRGV